MDKLYLVIYKRCHEIDETLIFDDRSKADDYINNHANDDMYLVVFTRDVGESYYKMC